MHHTTPTRPFPPFATPLLLASLCALHVGIAAAQSAAPVPAPSAAPMTAQSPAAKWSPEAAQAKMLQHWMHADSDKDGQLSKTEVQAAGLRPLVQFFDFIDTNKDGKLGEAELKAWAAASTTGRQERPRHSMNPQGTPPAHGKDQPHPPHEGGMNYKTPEQRRADMQERFNKADTNKDGGLSKAELQAAGMGRLLEHFDRIDANKDGKITPEEMQAAWPHRRQ
jgi:Ca2+-binding EF-hand superfamily protein